MINKDQFDSFYIEEQIHNINMMLQDGDSLSKVCKYIGIDESLISKRFAMYNYVFNNNKNRYIYIK